jgi:ubiquinone/menaquinone biosynthesis C-methylase UbiE
VDGTSAQPDVATKATRGLDGLTNEEIRVSRQGWWDELFTQFLLRWIPAETHRLIDIGCGLATAAHALLPCLGSTTYLGIDADENRLREADKLLAGTAYATRVELLRGRAEQLPCSECAADFALSSMTLQHVTDMRGALLEVKRVLCLGGRFVAIEPDNLGNRFYFDSSLQEVNAAFCDLFAAQRQARRPADTAIGPAVPRALEKTGFRVIDCHPYALGRVSRVSASGFFDRARRVASIACAAANLPPDNSVLQECLAAINRAVAAVGPETIGYGCQLVPVFVSVAEKEQ